MKKPGGSCAGTAGRDSRSPPRKPAPYARTGRKADARARIADLQKVGGGEKKPRAIVMAARNFLRADQEQQKGQAQ